MLAYALFLLSRAIAEGKNIPCRVRFLTCLLLAEALHTLCGRHDGCSMTSCATLSSDPMSVRSDTCGFDDGGSVLA